MKNEVQSKPWDWNDINDQDWEEPAQEVLTICQVAFLTLGH